MKRLLAALTLILALYVPAHALSDEDYIRLKRYPAFAEADRELTQAYNKAKESMTYADFQELRESQREWIESGRDREARRLMREEYTRVEAYTEVTRNRAAYIRREISEHSESASRPRPSTQRPRTRAQEQDSDAFTGYFNNGKDVYMVVQWINKLQDFMGVRFRYRDEEWFGRGKLHGKELTAESGNKSVTLHFVNANTIRVETNEAFNLAMGFDAEGRYRRNNTR